MKALMLTEYNHLEYMDVPEPDLDADGVLTEQVFDGTVWENGFSEREAVPGHYLVTARFDYYIPPHSGLLTTVTITKEFQWHSPSQ